MVRQSKSLGALRWTAGVKSDSVNELMMTGWLPEVGGMRGCRQAYRSCVRSLIGRRDLGGREGLGGRLGGRRALRREGEVGRRD